MTGKRRKPEKIVAEIVAKLRPEWRCRYREVGASPTPFARSGSSEVTEVA